MTTFSPVTTICCRGRLLDFSTPIVMGILNTTPDSFFAGSRRQTEHEIAARADEIVAQGATIIDIGAFSTRPGADIVSKEEETARLRRALEIVRRCQPDAIVSIDTYRPEVAQMCVEEYGADIINDVSEGGLATTADSNAKQKHNEVPQMFKTIAQLRVPYILTSVQNNTNTMLKRAAEEITMLHNLGATDIIFDPGLGFGKTLDDNYKILNQLEKTTILNKPLLVGASRKSMIWRLLDTDANNALNGTTTINTIALMKGASILRVHDVKEAMESIKIVEKLKTSNNI